MPTIAIAMIMAMVEIAKYVSVGGSVNGSSGGGVGDASVTPMAVSA